MQPLVSILAFALEANVNPLHLPFVVGVVYQLVVVTEGADDVWRGVFDVCHGHFFEANAVFIVIKGKFNIELQFSDRLKDKSNT